MQFDPWLSSSFPRARNGASLVALALVAALPAQASPGQWFVQTGGLSHHSQETQAKGRSWQENHPGLGVEHRMEGWGTSASDWVLSSSGGVMQDSRGFWSAYAGAAYVRQWKLGRTIETSLGLGAYGFYRSTNWKGHMAFVPAVMPVGTVYLADLGLSLNLAYVPRVASVNSAMPSVLYLQFGFRLP
jgi:hypothetical protein